jgi:hypothetical protein
VRSGHRTHRLSTFEVFSAYFLNDVACDVTKECTLRIFTVRRGDLSGVAFHEGSSLVPGHHGHPTEGKMLSTFRKENAIRSALMENLGLSLDYGYNPCQKVWSGYDRTWDCTYPY